MSSESKPTVASTGALSPDAPHSDGDRLSRRGEQVESTAGQHGVAPGDTPTRDDSSKGMLAAIVRSSDAAIISETLDGIVTSWNPSAEKIFGYTAAEMIGKPIDVIAARPGEMALILDRIRRGERVENFETERRHKDGHIVNISLTVSPIYDEKGRIIGASKIANDITERKRTEAQLQLKSEQVAEREARLRSILETAPDAVITIDERGIIQSFSPSAEKLFGYAAGEVIGHNVKMLMPELHRAKHDGYLERYLRTGEKHVIGIGREVEAQRKDGTIFPIQLAIGEVRLRDTHLFSGFIHDLSARIKMEEDLRRAQKMEAIGQLTGGIAHDFNNIIAVISGNLEMLDRRIVDAEGRDILKDTQEASQLGADLAKQLLAIGRRQPLQPRLTDLNTLVGGMIEMLRRSLGAMIEIETKHAEGLPMVMVDPGQVENALLNLSVNARDAMPKGGRLVIATAVADLDESYTAFHVDVAPGRYVSLTVTDTGTGMTPEVRRRAFEPFFTTKPPGQGTGLGLSMVYGFVKQSGGHVSLYSELGLGTTVRIYLPAQQGEARVTERSAGAPAPPTPTAAGETVLLVEDDPRVRRVSLRRLKDLGYVVLEADSGPAALKLLDEGADFDVLFTDVVMPGGMTGADLALEVRRRRPEVKILLTSGYAEPSVVTGGLSIAGAGWLGKPYGVQELQSKLRELLDH